jgi:L-threonylcarbamoyladenylate synthase
MIAAEQVTTFERCMAVGGVAVFPADTVYGLACDPTTVEAVTRLYALKGRRPDKPAAVMFFDVSLALASLPELGARTRALLEGLLPGGVTLLLPNPLRRFPLACGPATPDVLGVRVPKLTGALAPLGAVRWPVLQSSANAAGGPDARRVEEVPERIRRDADMILDGGELAGTPSTVVDARGFERDGSWRIVRQGAVLEDDVARIVSEVRG